MAKDICVPRAVGHSLHGVGGDKDRRMEVPEADKGYGLPTLSKRDMKRVEAIHVMPEVAPVYTKVK